MPDGWQNIRGDSVINVVVGNPAVSVFYRSFETGAEKQDTAYSREQFLKIIAEINQEHEGKVVAIVSDQGSNYLAARNEIQNQQHGVLSINCTAHLINLVAGDFARLPSVQKNITRAKDVVKEIRVGKRKLATYMETFQQFKKEQEENGGNKVRILCLSLPCVTRWFGIRILLGKIVNARPVLERMVLAPINASAQEIDLSLKTKNTIKSDTFWKKSQDLLEVFIKITDGR